MRVKYVGMDNRVRIAEASRVKFLEGGLQTTDKQAEWDSDVLHGPVVVVHIPYSKGGKRLMLEVAEDFDMEAAQQQLLEKGWCDLSCCPAKTENLY